MPSTPSPLLHLGHPEGTHIPFFQFPRQPSPVVPFRRSLIIVLAGIAAAFLGHWLEHVGEHASTPDVSLIWIVPFALLLCCIAVMPLLAHHFWEKYYPAISISLGGLVAVYYLFFLSAGPGAHGNFFEQRAGGALAKSLGEYVSFILMLAALFIICGGILVRVRRKASPAVNTGLLHGMFGGEQAARDTVTKFVPMKRISEPSEQAEVVLWLCSDAASFIVGHTLRADGGGFEASSIDQA